MTRPLTGLLNQTFFMPFALTAISVFGRLYALAQHESTLLCSLYDPLYRTKPFLTVLHQHTADTALAASFSACLGVLPAFMDDHALGRWPRPTMKVLPPLHTITLPATDTELIKKRKSEEGTTASSSIQTCDNSADTLPKQKIKRRRKLTNITLQTQHTKTPQDIQGIFRSLLPRTTDEK